MPPAKAQAALALAVQTAFGNPESGGRRGATLLVGFVGSSVCLQVLCCVHVTVFFHAVLSLLPEEEEEEEEEKVTAWV